MRGDPPLLMLPAMRRLLVGAVLWFYAGWYAGAMAAETLDTPSGLAPLAGAVVAAAVLTRLVQLWRRGSAPYRHGYAGREAASQRAM
jgi:hypothetical protein